MQFFRQQKQPVPQGGYEQPQQDPFDDLDNMVDDINQQYYQQPAQQNWANGDAFAEDMEQFAENLEDHLVPIAEGSYPRQQGQTGAWLEQPQQVEPAPQQYAEPAPQPGRVSPRIGGRGTIVSLRVFPPYNYKCVGERKY